MTSRRSARLAFIVAVVCAWGCGSTSSSTPAPAPAPAWIWASAGEHQTGAPARLLPVAPEVTVTDDAGAPLAGAAVVFAVTSGGGTISVARTVTDDAGHASCGGWTLGPAPGVQQLTASISTGSTITFAAAALRLSSDLTVAVEDPAWPQLVGASFPVQARVASTYSLSSVVAAIDDVSTPLRYVDEGSGHRYWQGRLAWPGATPRQAFVVFTATDAMGNVAQAAMEVRIDAKPVVAVASPAPESLARPAVHVAASCTDDGADGCASLSVSIGGAVLATSPSPMALDLDLSAYEGTAVELSIAATDPLGQVTTTSRTVYVESSPELSLVGRAPGAIWDFADGKLLYASGTDAARTLRLLDTSTGAEEVIAEVPGLQGKGFVTPLGAIFLPTYPAEGEVDEWRDHAVATVGEGYELRLGGAYALVTASSALVLRDVTARSSVTVDAQGSSVPSSADVTASGEVVYRAADGAIYRWSRGSAAKVSGSEQSCSSPITDGQHVVFASQRSWKTWTIVMAGTDGTNPAVLSTLPRMLPQSPADYAAAGGWVAFLRPDGMGVEQVWRRGASGEEQLTLFSSGSTIEGIGADGTVVLRHGARRFRARPGGPVQDVGSSLGRLVLRANGMFVIVGESVLQLD